MKRQFKVGDVVMFMSNPAAMNSPSSEPGEIGEIVPFNAEDIEITFIEQDAVRIKVSNGNSLICFKFRLYLLSTAEEMEPVKTKNKRAEKVLDEAFKNLSKNWRAPKSIPICSRGAFLFIDESGHVPDIIFQELGKMAFDKNDKLIVIRTKTRKSPRQKPNKD